jgi:hypothetical protein
MAGQDVTELMIAGDAGGHAWAAPLGTVLPVGLAAPGTGWVDMGYLSEDGFTITPSVESEDIKVWPLKQAARTVVTEEIHEIGLAFAQWNADTLAMYFGGTWADTAGVKTLEVPLARASYETALVIDFSDGDRQYRYVLPRVNLTDFEEITHKLGEPALLGVTGKALPASGATSVYSVITDDAAVVVTP